MTIENDVDYGVGLGAIRDLLERNGITPEEVGQLHRIKDVTIFQQGMKLQTRDDEGNILSETPYMHDLASVTLSPKWEEGPEWELVQRGPVTAKDLKVGPAPISKLDGWTDAFIVPDMQIGYYHGPDGELISTHDERAIELVLQIMKKHQPHKIIMVGDNLDFPEFGRYRLSPAFAQTTQASIDYATVLMYRIRLACPGAEIVWIAGNHEERLPNWLLDNACPAFGIKQGKQVHVVEEGEEFPVLSVPHLCRLDDVGVTYLPGYPTAEYWINERLKVIHGKFVKSRGSTSHKYLDAEKVSVLYGHIHRIEDNLRTFDSWAGPSTIRAASPGTLAKTDGAVPSTKGGLDLYGRPLPVVEDWQQGFGFVRYKTEGSHHFFYNNYPIIDYMAEFQGKIYEG